MRPRKKILVFSVDEDELGRLGYVLWTRVYQPVLASTLELALLAEGDFDCCMVMASVQPDVAEAVARALARARPGLPIVVFARAGAPLDVTLPALVRYGLNVAAMLEALKVLASRKRGPKPSGQVGPPRGYLTSALQRVG